MKTAKNGKKIKAILELLSSELAKGRLCFQIAQCLQHKLKHSGPLISPSFLSGSYQACLDQAILSLAKLGIFERESVSVEYLLNCASQNVKAFRFASLGELEMKIEHHRHLLAEQKPFFDKVKGMRDRILAHLDRKHINEPDVIEQVQIEFNEIDHCFTIFVEILNTYKGYYDRSQLDLSSNQQIIQDEVDNLVGFKLFSEF